MFEIISKSKKTILSARAKRIKPSLDDKILCSWNALMLTAYLDAYEAFNEESFLQKAIQSANFIQEKLMQPNGKLLRAYKDEKASINAFLDDYAFVIQAFIKLSKNTLTNNYLEIAIKLTNYALEHFYDSNSGMFFYSSNLSNDLYMRKMELNDNVIPSSNATMALNLYELSIYTQNDEFLNISKQMLANTKPDLEENSYFKYQWNYLYSLISSEPIELVINGSNAKNVLQAISKEFLPGIFVAATEKDNNLAIFKNRFVEGKTLIYICRNKSCNLPLESIDEAIKEIQNL